MRKLLTGAVAASATLALAAGAAAQVSTPSGDATLDVSASPSNAGTKKKPKNVRLSFKQVVNKPGTTVQTITVDLPKGLKFSGKGFKRCNFDDLVAQGPSACPSGSKVGPTGRATARLEPAVSGQSDLVFQVSPFIENSKTVAIYLRTTAGLDIQTAIRGKLTNSGRRMTIEIPMSLRQPLPGLDATLTGIDQLFSGKRGKNYFVSSTGCTGKKWAVKGSLGFATRSNGTPGPPSESLTENVRCSK